MRIGRLAKVFQRGASVKIRNRLVLSSMKWRRVTPLTVSLSEAEVFFFAAQQNNRRLVGMLSPFLPSARCVFDIGANAGFFSKELLTANPGYRGRLVLFEPISHLMSLAVRAVSGFTQVEKVFVNAALGDKSGEVQMYLPPNLNIGWITAAPTTERQRHFVSARISPSSEFLKLYRPEIIKIDVEGYEAHILHGMLPLVNSTYKPIFLVEIEFSQRGGSNWRLMERCIEAFHQAGYNFYGIDGHQYTAADLSNLTEVADILMRPAESL